jgi:hypothetical protein
VGSSLAVIHCNPGVPWQLKRGNYFAEGLRAAGLKVEFTSDRFRHDEGFPILLGTTFWKDIERDGDFLLVDRCSFGSTDQFVSLVWNGHGRRGDHKAPSPGKADPRRWESMGVDLQPWCTGGSRVVLCGQTETYSPHWPSLDQWYASVKATHFRKHPASVNTTRLPDAIDFTDTKAAVTLNSSVGVWCVIHGIPTVTMDEGAMAWDVTGHSLDDIRMPDREPWCHWLAHTQWSDDEIRKGDLWASLL